MGRKEDKRVDDSRLCSNAERSRVDMRVQMWKDKEAKSVECKEWKEQDV